MMIHKKLKDFRKKLGISQEIMAQIICTDPSNYSRKERGEIRMRDDEWEKIANALNVCVEDIKDKIADNNADPENSLKNATPQNETSYLANSNSVIENLQDYILLLKKEIKQLKEENNLLKSQRI